MQADYMPLSPTLYCGADPVNRVDPSGRFIQGATENDAKLAVEDLHEIFSAPEFDGFRDLIRADGARLANIDSNALKELMEGLSDDQKALLEIVVNTINSEDEHIVEFTKKDGVLSKTGSRVFDEMLNIKGVNRDATYKMYGGRIPSLMAESRGGGMTKFIRRGSYSVIVIDGAHTVNRAVTTGHEIFGHGRSHAVSKKLNQDQEAIRTENLIRRVMGFEDFNDGRSHTKKGKPVEAPTILPSFR